jgi:hypothetical protein
MSRNRYGIAAAVILAMFATSGVTVAQGKKKEKEAAAAPGVIAQKDRDRGMAEAPALAKAAGLTCNVTEARFILTDAKNKTNYFEIACDQGFGFVVEQNPAKPAAGLFPCVNLEDKVDAGGGKMVDSPLKCRLAGNGNLNGQVASYMTKAGKTCTPSGFRYIGNNATKTFIEVACGTGVGYVLETSYPANLTGDAKAQSCLVYDTGSTLACTLTTRESQMAVVDSLAATSGKTCVVTDKRYVLTTPAGANWFEVACQAGNGFMLEQVDGKNGKTVPCAEASFVGGGCTMTDALAAKTEQNGLYTSLAGKVGFKCNVAQYGVFNVPDKEIVELKCNDRPDGAVIEFKGAASGVVYPCAIAEAQGYRCSFTKKDSGYAQLSRDIKSLRDTSTCEVRESRAMDKASEGAVYVEANCADGNGSYVLGYARGSTKPVEVLSCAQAKPFGACKLPGN